MAVSFVFLCYKFKTVSSNSRNEQQWQVTAYQLDLKLNLKVFGTTMRHDNDDGSN